MKTNQLLKRLNAAGCDVEDTLYRLLGDEELYVRLLEAFCRERSWEALELAVKSEDYTAAGEIAHSIKGSLVTLGLTPLVEEIKYLTEDLKKERYDALKRSLIDFLELAERLRETVEG